MIKSILADFLQGSFPAASTQKPEAGLSVIDETFQKIFGSIQEADRQIKNRVEDNKTYDRKDDDTRADNHRDDDKTTDDNNISEQESDTYTSYDETDGPAGHEDEYKETDAKELNKEYGEDENRELDESAKSEEKAQIEKAEIDKLTEAELKEKVLKLLKELLADTNQVKNSDKDLASLEKATSMIAKKLFELSKSDPEAYKKLMEDISKISFKENKGKNLGQAISQMIELAKQVGAQSGAAAHPEAKNIESLLKKTLTPEEKRESAPAPEDKKTALRDISEKGEKRADGQLFDKVIDTGKTKQEKVKAANNKGAAIKQVAAKQAPSKEAVNSGKDQVKPDVKPNSVKITNNAVVETNPPPGNSNKTTSAEQPQVRAKFGSREVFERMLVDQIVKKARINIRANGASNIVVQITPPNLGKVNIRIAVQDNVVKAYMIVDNPEVKSILESNLDNLKNSMNNQGLKVDQITVTISDAHTQSRNETLGNDFGSDRNRDNQGHELGADQEQGMEGEMTSAQVRALAHDGVLNIVA